MSDLSDLSDMRRSYEHGALAREDLDLDPVRQFEVLGFDIEQLVKPHHRNQLVADFDDFAAIHATGNGLGLNLHRKLIRDRGNHDN